MTINVLIMAAFVILAATVASLARYEVKAVVYETRRAQAQAIAEAGLEDALHSLYNDTSWRLGISSKTLAGGYYSVTLTTDTLTPPTITSVGWSAPIFMLGRVKRTVTATAQYLNYNCTNAIQADSGITLYSGGSVDAYDPAVSLTPSSFTAGANIWSNTTIAASGTCPPNIVSGNATAVGSLPAACYVSGTETTSPTTLSIPTHACSNCDTVNDNLTGIGPQSAYNSSSNQLVVNNQTVTLEPGRYFIKKLTIKNNGILSVNTSTGTVTLYLNGNWTTTAPCQINNTSKIPSRFQIYDVSNAGHSVPFLCSTPLHVYVEGVWAQADVQQPIYGHFCSGRVTIEATGSVHYDLKGGSVSHVTWTTGSAGSWAVK